MLFGVPDVALGIHAHLAGHPDTGRSAASEFADWTASWRVRVLDGAAQQGDILVHKGATSQSLVALAIAPPVTCLPCWSEPELWNRYVRESPSLCR